MRRSQSEKAVGEGTFILPRRRKAEQPARWQVIWTISRNWAVAAALKRIVHLVKRNIFIVAGYKAGLREGSVRHHVHVGLAVGDVGGIHVAWFLSVFSELL